MTSIFSGTLGHEMGFTEKQMQYLQQFMQAKRMADEQTRSSMRNLEKAVETAVTGVPCSAELDLGSKDHVWWSERLHELSKAYDCQIEGVEQNGNPDCVDLKFKLNSCGKPSEELCSTCQLAKDFGAICWWCGN